jgi:hypothetical protein
MVDHVNVITFIVIISVIVMLIGRILELDEAVLARDYRIRMLERNIRRQAKVIEMLQAAAAEDDEELEEGEIRPASGGAYHANPVGEIRPVRRQASS